MNDLLHRISALLFPPKCTFCRKLLKKEETDLCHSCRKNTPEYKHSKNNIPFVAGWTGIWYYTEGVRNSLLRYKFYNARSYAQVYGRFLAMKLQTEFTDGFDVLTWVPVSPFRKFCRGYDQVELLAKQVAKELDVSAVPVIKKIRHTPPQSKLKTAAQRRANILGAYRVSTPDTITAKRIMLLDDILTTGATASECARVLLTAGAEKVYFAAVAVANHDKKKQLEGDAYATVFQ